MEWLGNCPELVKVGGAVGDNGVEKIYMLIWSKECEESWEEGREKVKIKFPYCT